jgi:hypothetical protein
MRRAVRVLVDTELNRREMNMGRTLAIIGALIMVATAGWFASTGSARTPAATTQVDPFQAMVSATNLPALDYKDYSLVF